MKCHVRVRYAYYVEPDSEGMDANPSTSQDVRQKPTALPIPMRSGHQGSKAKGKTPKGKTPKSAAKTDATPKAGLPAKAGKPANDDSAFFPSVDDDGDANAEPKDAPTEDPDALEKLFNCARESLGEQSSVTIHVKTQWEAALRARENP